MPSLQIRKRREAFANGNFMPSEEELKRCVESRTDRRVYNLSIHSRGSRVQLLGRSRSYYVKQLATDAIFKAFPEAALDNEIRVISE